MSIELALKNIVAECQRIHPQDKERYKISSAFNIFGLEVSASASDVELARQLLLDQYNHPFLIHVVDYAANICFGNIDVRRSHIPVVGNVELFICHSSICGNGEMLHNWVGASLFSMFYKCRDCGNIICTDYYESPDRREIRFQQFMRDCIRMGVEIPVNFLREFSG